MKIRKLILENFHGFKRREITFSDQCTVLIGDNGTGKTAILDGLAVVLGGFFLGFDAVGTRHIRPDEARRETKMIGELTHSEPQFPVRVTCEGNIDGRLMNWIRSVERKRGTTRRTGATDVIRYSEELQDEVRKNLEVMLPLISYYGTGRLWVQKKEKSVDRLEKGSRLAGYTDCLDPASNEKLFTKWFRKMVMIELQRRKELGVLAAIRSAVASCMGTWATIDYDLDAEEIRARLSDGSELPFRLLSDGVRNMLGMVADIAYRMVVLNPHLGENAVRETPGVVLIDEIDLHLHPKWQRRIIDDLKRTFPKVQFVVTTHSPFIVQSLQAGELRLLLEVDNDEVVSYDKYVGKSLEDVVENVMDIEIPQRSNRYQEMYSVAKRYYQLLNQAEHANEEEKERLKVELDRLSAPFSNDVAYYAFLEMERVAAGLGRKKNETD